MKYKICFEKSAYKQLSKIDITQQRIIVSWIMKNLENTNNTIAIGKTLKGKLKTYRRYRVGNYRIIADINDTEIKIIIVNIGMPIFLEKTKI